MFHCTDDTPICRGCGKVLKGSPYFRGGRAYIIETGAAARVNHYGGWVCSENCDRRACLEQENSMPGHSYKSRTLDQASARRVASNWSEQ